MRCAFRLEPFAPQSHRNRKLDQLVNRVGDEVTRRSAMPPVVSKLIDVNCQVLFLLRRLGSNGSRAVSTPLAVECSVFGNLVTNKAALAAADADRNHVALSYPESLERRSGVP